ncbi:hypothetical protein GQ54DRAFT_297094 [Martensiomyces pterosporus]|nr:hypothetical protein GQ54DRAFT_297094 [Martensiomyces pterosporus]
MNSHPKYQEVADICERYPLRARALFQAYLDLKYEQRLPNVHTGVLEQADVPVVIAATAGSSHQLFIPVMAAEDISMSWISSALKESQKLVASTQTGDKHLEAVHLCIVDTDSTLVYYKISQGFEPPAV